MSASPTVTTSTVTICSSTGTPLDSYSLDLPSPSTHTPEATKEGEVVPVSLASVAQASTQALEKREVYEVPKRSPNPVAQLTSSVAVESLGSPSSPLALQKTLEELQQQIEESIQQGREEVENSALQLFDVNTDLQRENSRQISLSEALGYFEGIFSKAQVLVDQATQRSSSLSQKKKEELQAYLSGRIQSWFNYSLKVLFSKEVEHHNDVGAQLDILLHIANTHESIRVEPKNHQKLMGLWSEHHLFCDYSKEDWEWALDANSLLVEEPAIHLSNILARDRNGNTLMTVYATYLFDKYSNEIREFVHKTSLSQEDCQNFCSDSLQKIKRSKDILNESQTKILEKNLDTALKKALKYLIENAAIPAEVQPSEAENDSDTFFSRLLDFFDKVPKLKLFARDPSISRLLIDLFIIESKESPHLKKSDLTDLIALLGVSEKEFNAEVAWVSLIQERVSKCEKQLNSLAVEDRESAFYPFEDAAIVVGNASQNLSADVKQELRHRLIPSGVLQKYFDDNLSKVKPCDFPELLKALIHFPELSLNFECMKNIEVGNPLVKGEITLIDLLTNGFGKEKKILTPFKLALLYKEKEGEKEKKVKVVCNEFERILGEVEGECSTASLPQAAKIQQLITEVLRQKDPKLEQLLYGHFRKWFDLQLASADAEKMEILLDYCYSFPRLGLNLKALLERLEAYSLLSESWVEDITRLHRIKSRLELRSKALKALPDGEREKFIAMSERIDEVSKRIFIKINKKPASSLVKEIYNPATSSPFVPYGTSGRVKRAYLCLGKWPQLFKEPQKSDSQDLVATGTKIWNKIQQTEEGQQRLMSIGFCEFQRVGAITCDFWTIERFAPLGDVESFLKRKLQGISLSIEEREKIYKAVVTLLIPLSEALKFLHANETVHLDVKLANTLLRLKNRTFTCELSDVDFCTNKEAIEGVFGVSLRGSPTYMPPRLLKLLWPRPEEEYRYNKFEEAVRQDLYAFGMMLLVLNLLVNKGLLMREEPFEPFFNIAQTLIEDDQCSSIPGGVIQGAAYISEQLKAMQEQKILPSKREALSTLGLTY